MIDIEKMPVVKTVIDKAREDITKLIGVHVVITVEELPLDKSFEQLEMIANLVCEEFKVRWKDVTGKKRHSHNGLVDARHSFMYISHKVMGFFSTAVGEYIGGKDHTTVLHACKKIEGFIEVGDPICEKINRILEKINQPGIIIKL